MPGKTDHAHRQCHACQKIQALRDHPYNGRHHGNDTVTKTGASLDILLPEQKAADRNDGDADHSDQLIQYPQHFRLFLFVHGCGLGAQTGGIGIRSDMLQPRTASSGYQITAGAQFIARCFADLVFLTGQQGFIGTTVAGKKDRIGTDLIASVKLHHIVLYQFLSRNFPHFPFPNDHCPRSIQQRQLIKLLFGAQLLNDPDQRVDDHHGEKCQTAQGSCGNDQRGQNQKYQIEVCEQVLFDDRGDTSGTGPYGGVDEARVLLRLHLRLSQTKLGAWR